MKLQDVEKTFNVQVIKEDIDQQYMQRVANIYTLLHKIKSSIDDHARYRNDPDNLVQTNWGYVGDLEYVEKSLRDVAKFIKNT